MFGLTDKRKFWIWSFIIFGLNSPEELKSLYSFCRFPQRRGVLYRTVSKP